LFAARIHYAWHPAFDKEVEVQYRESRRGETVRVCVMEDQSGLVIPDWMFDRSKCASFTIGAPRVSIPAIVDLRALLTEIGFDRHPARPDVPPQEKIDAKSTAALDSSSDHEPAGVGSASEARNRNPRQVDTRRRGSGAGKTAPRSGRARRGRR
jgi:hypothetical protein